MQVSLTTQLYIVPSSQAEKGSFAANNCPSSSITRTVPTTDDFNRGPATTLANRACQPTNEASGNARVFFRIQTRAPWIRQTQQWFKKMPRIASTRGKDEQTVNRLSKRESQPASRPPGKPAIDIGNRSDFLHEAATS